MGKRFYCTRCDEMRCFLPSGKKYPEHTVRCEACGTRYEGAGEEPASLRRDAARASKWLSFGPLTPEQIRVGQEIAAKHGLLANQE